MLRQCAAVDWRRPRLSWAGPARQGLPERRPPRLPRHVSTRSHGPTRPHGAARRHGAARLHVPARRNTTRLHGLARAPGTSAGARRVSPRHGASWFRCPTCPTTRHCLCTRTCQLSSAPSDSVCAYVQRGSATCRTRPEASCYHFAGRCSAEGISLPA